MGLRTQNWHVGNVTQDCCRIHAWTAHRHGTREHLFACTSHAPGIPNSPSVGRLGADGGIGSEVM